MGRYISPTVVCYEERIQVNEEFISREALSRLTEKVSHAVEQTKAREGFTPTVFEIETGIAFLYFLECGCDIVTLECGMGGDTDATNVVDTTIVSVIASVSMDHMGFLGDTLAEIASHKAGIIKKGVPAVTVRQKPEAMKVIEEKAREMGSELTVVDSDRIFDVSGRDLTLHFSYKSSSNTYKDLKISLPGEYQTENASLAIEVCEVLGGLGFNITPEHIKKGLGSTVWVGRFTKICDDPVIIIDGAHNEAAAIRLERTLDIYFTNRKLMYIMGVLKDKEYDKILDVMLPHAKEVITITPDNPRALSAKELAREIRARGVEAHPEDNIEKAVSRSIDMAGKDSAILSFGSLYYLGEIIQAVKNIKGKL